MKNEKKTVLALLVLAVALLVWRGLGPPVSSVESSEVKPLAEAAAQRDETSVAAAAVAAPGNAISTTAPPPASASLVPAIRAQRLDDYANSQDLQQFIDSLLAAANAGDGEAAGLIMRAYEECYIAIIGAKAGRRMHVDVSQLAEPQRSIAAAQTAISQRRCSGLIAQAAHHDLGWAMEQIKTFRVKAQAGGDLGQLVNNGDVSTLELSAADDNELLRRIAASGNDDAVAVLALSVVDPDGERDIRGPFSGLPVDAYAWMLVSCDLGRDCEPNGRLVRDKCLTLNMCIAGSYRDYIRYYMTTPHQFDEALKKERQILELLARGAVDELFPLRPKSD